MNLEKRRKLKIRNLPYAPNNYETYLMVHSVAPCQKGNLNLEIKITEWVLNWN